MSCAVVLIEAGIIYRGADAIAIAADSKTISRAPKVFKRGNMLFGTCGSVKMRNLRQYDLTIPVYSGRNVVEYLVKDFVNAVRDCFKQCGRVDQNWRNDSWLTSANSTDHGRMWKSTISEH